MKILIWIKKEEAISGAITEHHYTIPQAGYQNYVQVEVSQDEFAQLEDKTSKDVMGPAIKLENMTELELRMYKESQSITGGEFSNCHRNLTTEERQTYTRIYGH